MPTIVLVATALAGMSLTSTSADAGTWCVRSPRQRAARPFDAALDQVREAIHGFTGVGRRPSFKDPFIEMMEAHGIPITRENYIGLNWGKGHVMTAEDEEELPPELRKTPRAGTKSAPA